ncbi:MAG: hypothetical protein U1F25_18755 [Rubrivivax sp.]
MSPSGGRAGHARTYTAGATLADRQAEVGQRFGVPGVQHAAGRQHLQQAADDAGLASFSK